MIHLDLDNDKKECVDLERLSMQHVVMESFEPLISKIFNKLIGVDDTQTIVDEQIEKVKLNFLPSSDQNTAKKIIKDSFFNNIVTPNEDKLKVNINDSIDYSCIDLDENNQLDILDTEFKIGNSIKQQLDTSSKFFSQMKLDLVDDHQKYLSLIYQLYKMDLKNGESKYFKKIKCKITDTIDSIDFKK